MRGFASYSMAAFFVVLALDMIAPPAGFGFSPVTAAPADNAALYNVNRTNKGDRAPMMTVGKQQPDQQAPKMLPGCDPAFSPLSASARANFARSCVA